jgi:hypothetical protein
MKSAALTKRKPLKRLEKVPGTSRTQLKLGVNEMVPFLRKGRTTAFGVAFGFALACCCCFAEPKSGSNTNGFINRPLSPRLNAATNQFLIVTPGHTPVPFLWRPVSGFTNLWSTSSIPSLLLWRSFITNRSPMLPGARTIKPGVYEAEPFTAIVVVPAPHTDDRCIVGGGALTEQMPIVKPDLRLIPRERLR